MVITVIWRFEAAHLQKYHSQDKHIRFIHNIVLNHRLPIPKSQHQLRRKIHKLLPLLSQIVSTVLNELNRKQFEWSRLYIIEDVLHAQVVVGYPLSLQVWECIEDRLSQLKDILFREQFGSIVTTAQKLSQSGIGAFKEQRRVDRDFDAIAKWNLSKLEDALVLNASGRVGPWRFLLNFRWHPNLLRPWGGCLLTHLTNFKL